MTSNEIAVRANDEGTHLDQSRERPPRPPLANPNHPPPVLIKQPPPFTVRLSQLLWALSFIAGALAVIYLVVIRQDQLPLISEAIRDVDTSRTDPTYSEAAGIVFWTAFGTMIGVLLVQITLLVSFMSRRPGIRWWQFASVVVEVILFALIVELVARGESGLFLQQLLSAQAGLAVLAMLMGAFPGAIAWTARQHDIKRGTIVTSPGTEL